LFIPVPDWPNAGLSGIPAFKTHFTKVHVVNLFISCEINTVRLRKNPWIVRSQICKFTRRNSGKLEWGNPRVFWHTEGSVSHNPHGIMNKPTNPLLFSQNMGKISNFYLLRSESKRIWIFFASYSHFKIFAQISRTLRRDKVQYMHPLNR
jgi:hypothetical protein